MTSAREDIWSFAQRLYARPGMSAACIDFQDRHDGDVDLVLLLLHYAQSNRALSVRAVTEADRAAEVWRTNVILPLRRLRRGLKSAPPAYDQAPALRKTIADTEIEAERMQLLRLVAMNLSTNPADSPHEAALFSLAAYCTLLGIPANAASDLLRIYKAAATNETLG